MAAATPATDVLALLHRYHSLRASADSELKSSIFNITKARRGRAHHSAGGREFSADDVREELRARAVLEWKGGGDGDVEGDGIEPRLMDESEEDGGKDVGAGGRGGFVLHLDGIGAADRRRGAAPGGEGAQESNDVIVADDKESWGLRRRRGKDEDESKENDDRWTTEEPAASTATVEDEEERLRNTDPLNLFGVPPPALRVAQAKSRSAVAYYVEVANLAREILETTREM